MERGDIIRTSNVKSNIDIRSNIVLATRWNVFRFGLLHLWWRSSDWLKRCLRIA